MSLLLLVAPATALAQKPELKIQVGHSSHVMSIAFSPDGKTLASGSNDKTIKLWDVTTGAQLRTLEGHSNPVYSVAFSPDGKILASASGDKTIKLWDVSTGAQLRTLEGHSSDVYSVSFSPDGKTLASGGHDETIKLWDVSTGTQLRTLEGHHIPVHSVAFSPDGKTLASGGGTLASSSLDNTIKLWDVSTGAEVRTLEGHSSYVNSVAFSPDGKTLASGSNDETIKLWDVSTGAQLRTLVEHSSHVSSIAFSPDGKTLASGSNDETIKLWDVSTGMQVRTLEGHADELTSSIAFSPDGKTLASASGDKSIMLWDVSTGARLRALEGHTVFVVYSALSHDGKILASMGIDKTIRLRLVSTGAEFSTLKETSYFSSMALSPDGKTLASGNWDNAIKLWDVSTGVKLRTLEGHSNPAHSLVFSPDGKILASLGADKTFKLWDVSSGAELHTLKMNSYLISSIAFSPDGKTLASGSWDKTIKLWDVSTGAQLHTLEGQSNPVYSVAFSPDGKTLASESAAKIIRLWDVSSGAQLRTLAASGTLPGLLKRSLKLEGPSYEGTSNIAFSPDGKTLASGSWDKTIRLWDVSTGAQLHMLEGHSSYINSIAFSPNGKYLVSGSFDTNVKLWDTNSGQELATLITFGENDWVVIAPDGLFDGSPAAWNKIIWRFNNNTFNYAPVEAFFNEFYYPGLLADILAGKCPKAPSDISQKDRRQPQLKLALSHDQPNATLTARNLTVKIDVSQAPAGAQDLRLFRNGTLVKVWRGDVLKGQSSVTLEATIPIVAGENRLTAYAFNHDNIKSSDATLVINGAESLKRSGTAYILAVGINNYSNPQYNLKYAVADAQDFSAEVKRQQELLKRYAQVEVISLSDAEATKANITQKLTQLARRIQPEDAVIIYFAGHGTAQGKQFYLIPHDLGYNGSRENLKEAGLQTILAHSISDRELEKLFEGIDAGQLLLVIDACNSGQALEAEEKRRGPMNSKGLAQLAYEKGMYVLTAAQSYQAAQEAKIFGHGFLTYALVERGLKQGAADREPKDRAINLREWLNYATEEVPKMQELNSLEALRGRGRYVVFVGDGSRAGEANKKDEARDNIQRPRLFYRREVDANPLVVAILGATSPQ
jgi:WD40 repeat protein